MAGLELGGCLGEALGGLGGWGGTVLTPSYASVTKEGKLRVGKTASRTPNSPTPEQPYAASDPGTIALGPNLARALSATASIRRARSSAGSNVS